MVHRLVRIDEDVFTDQMQRLWTATMKVAADHGDQSLAKELELIHHVIASTAYYEPKEESVAPTPVENP